MRSYLPGGFLGKSCTVLRRNGAFCDAPSDEDVPFPICTRHALKLYRHMRERIAEAMPGETGALHFATQMFKADQEAADRKHAAAEWVVYYVQVGDVIKIGVTGRLRHRLNAYPPFSKLLAREPGDHFLEAKRHQQFAHLRVAGKEWYRPDPELLAFIEKVKLGAVPTS